MEKLTIQQQIGLVYAQEQTLRKTGLWANPELQEKYRYRLSPDCVVFTVEEKRELEEIADAIYAPGGYLDGGLKLLRKIQSQQFVGTISGGAIKKSLLGNISKADCAMQEVGPDEMPFISRLDLIKVSKNDLSEPSFQIAEVEGDKTHGFGYSSLMGIFCEAIAGNVDRKSIIDALEEELERKGLYRNAPILLVVGMSERFYLTELEIFAKVAKARGLNLTTAQEDTVRVGPDGLVVRGRETNFTTLINIPTLTNYSGLDQAGILDLYKNGKIQALIPPKRTLGSKGLLGIVRNGDCDPDVEKALEACFDPRVLAKLRRFIPPTFVVTRKNIPTVEKLLTDEPDSWVIKQTVASGTKGVALPSDVAKKDAFVKKAKEAPFSFVMQRKVDQETREFNFCEPEALSMIKKARMYMRVEMYATRSGLATVDITARETPSVHGAKDCIQIPVIFT